MKDTVKIEKGATRIIAHRGAGGVERENTIPAFVASGNRTYYGQECDIHVTADGKFLVYHDDNTGRLCNADLVMEQTPSEKLRALKIKETDSEEFSETLKMPTFEEYLAVAARYDKVAVVELKLRMSAEKIAEAVELCRKHYSLDKVIFISFFFENLVDLRKLLPNQAAQFLISEWKDDLPSRLAEYGFGLDIGYWALTEERVKALHAKGIPVNCWTCNEPEEAKKLIGWGVDYITTDILE